MRKRYPLPLLIFACILAGSCARPAAPPATAQAGAPSPSATALPSPTPTLTPTPTTTPLPVLIANPTATPTPVSPWPQVDKAVATVRALWQQVPLVGSSPSGSWPWSCGRSARSGGPCSKSGSEQIADWLDDRLKNLAAKVRAAPPRTTRLLLQDLLDRYQYLEMKGFVREKVMTASLESVYVPLLTQPEGAGRQGRTRRRGGLLVREASGEPAPLTALLPATAAW